MKKIIFFIILMVLYSYGADLNFHVSKCSNISSIVTDLKLQDGYYVKRALLKIYTTEENCIFTTSNNNYIYKVEYDTLNNCYLISLNSKIKWITVNKKSDVINKYNPLSFNLSDYNIHLENSKSYAINLTADPPSKIIAIVCKQKNSTVLFDDSIDYSAGNEGMYLVPLGKRIIHISFKNYYQLDTAINITNKTGVLSFKLDTLLPIDVTIKSNGYVSFNNIIRNYYNINTKVLPLQWYKINIQKEGYKTLDSSLYITKSNHDFNFNLQRLYSTIQVNAPSKCNIKIDSKNIVDMYYNGNHTIKISCNGYIDSIIKVNIIHPVDLKYTINKLKRTYVNLNIKTNSNDPKILIDNDNYDPEKYYTDGQHIIHISAFYYKDTIFTYNFIKGSDIKLNIKLKNETSGFVALGLKYLHNNNIDLGIRYLDSASNCGSEYASYELGKFYWKYLIGANEQNTYCDKDKAITYFLKSESYNDSSYIYEYAYSNDESILTRGSNNGSILCKILLADKYEKYNSIESLKEALNIYESLNIDSLKYKIDSLNEKIIVLKFNNAIKNGNYNEAKLYINDNVNKDDYFRLAYLAINHTDYSNALLYLNKSNNDIYTHIALAAVYYIIGGDYNNKCSYKLYQQINDECLNNEQLNVKQQLKEKYDLNYIHQMKFKKIKKYTILNTIFATLIGGCSYLVYHILQD